jgi:hypothetical protein
MVDPGSGLPTVASDLASDGSTPVLTTTSIQLKFDRFMLPTDVIRQAVCLQSSTMAVRSPTDCKTGVLLNATYDPVTRIAKYYQASGRLAAGELYKVTVLTGTGGFGFRAFDGVPLDQNYEFSFTPIDPVPADPMKPTPTEAPESGTGYCGATTCGNGCFGGAGAVLASSCDTCHGNPSQDGVLAMGLSVTTIDGLTQTAIGKVAHETEDGGAARIPTEHPLRFGVSMPIIMPSDPGQSYLLYKILANDLAPLAVDPTDPEDVLQPGELERLRQTVVTGLPMPARSIYSPDPSVDPHDPNAPTLNRAGLLKISDWIAAGAVMPLCP